MRIKGLLGMTSKNKDVRQLFLVIPSYGDSKSVVEICHEVETILDCPIKICILDDSGGVDFYPDLPDNYAVFSTDKNLGQQRILTDFFRFGLARTFPVQEDDLVIIMDGDGEDSPQDVPRLLAKMEIEEVNLVTARRGSRSVSINFKISYFCFKLGARILSGKSINHGTFSVSKRSELESWVKKDAFYQSFVGGLISTKTPKSFVNCDRSPRRYGTSRLDKSGLIEHGLRILISLSALISTRLLMATFAWIIFSVFFGVFVVIFKYLGNSTPGWASFVVGFLIQVTILLLVALLTTIGLMRNQGEDPKNSEFKLRIYGK